MTNHEFIDQTIAKLTAQGAYGMGVKDDGAVTCCYRTPQKNCCAIGLWLDDEQAEYCDSKAYSARDVAREYPEIFDGVDRDMMIQMQGIHDRAAEEDLTIEACCNNLLALKYHFN